MPNIETCEIRYTKRTCAKSFSTRFDDSGETFTSVSDLIKLMPDEFTKKQVRFVNELFTALGETSRNSIRANNIFRLTKNQYDREKLRIMERHSYAQVVSSEVVLQHQKFYMKLFDPFDGSLAGVIDTSYDAS